MKYINKNIYLIFFIIIIVFLASFAQSKSSLIQYQNSSVIEDNWVTNNQYILLNYSSLNFSSYILYSVILKDKYNFQITKMDKLCSPCYPNKNYLRLLKLNKGENIIDLINHDNNREQTNISYDNSYPELKKVIPENNGYSNGKLNFIIKEEKLNFATIVFRKVNEYNWTTKEINISSQCNYLNGFYNCTKEFYDEGDYYYYFRLKDEIYEEVYSRAYRIKIDKTVPIIWVLSPNNEVNKRRINLIVGASEESELNLEIDRSNNQILLCKSCTLDKRNFMLKNGEHILIISAQDKAGNIDRQIIKVNIVS